MNDDYLKYLFSPVRMDFVDIPKDAINETSSLGGSVDDYEYDEELEM